MYGIIEYQMIELQIMIYLMCVVLQLVVVVACSTQKQGGGKVAIVLLGYQRNLMMSFRILSNLSDNIRQAQ